MRAASAAMSPLSAYRLDRYTFVKQRCASLITLPVDFEIVFFRNHPATLQHALNDEFSRIKCSYTFFTLPAVKLRSAVPLLLNGV